MAPRRMQRRYRFHRSRTLIVAGDDVAEDVAGDTGEALGFFFDIHRNLAASPESEKVKTALIDYIKANQLPIANVQSYENALNALIANRTIEQAVSKVSATNPIQRYGGTAR